MTKRSILLAALAGPALLLGGCMGTENRGLESVHQPVVSRTDYVFDAATSESQRVSGWMTSLRLAFGDRITIEDPAGDGYAARGQISGIVAGYGLLTSDDPTITGAPVAPGTIRIVVSRMKATVPGCPDWSRDESTEFNANTSSNQGCAINGNLAAMVARPEDLIHGAADTGTNDVASSAKAIVAYRKAEPTGNGNAVRAESAKGN